jgi:endonuclease III-like uncharacterized protein
MLFYNDCMYIARELEKIPARFEDGIPGMDEVQYDDVIPALKALAKQWLEIQVVCPDCTIALSCVKMLGKLICALTFDLSKSNGMN